MVRNSRPCHKEKKPVTDFSSQLSEEGRLPMWLPNQIIRNRNTGEPLLVIHVYRNCTIVVDTKDKNTLITPMALLEREYHYYTRDGDMRNKDEVNYEKEWFYKPVKM
jgi:hypothetical protein